MAKVLAVGIATLDIINSVNTYPNEDDEVRALSQRLCRGGNATNTLTVLSQLGHQCYWAGVLADEPDVRHIEADLDRHQLNTSAVTRLATGKVPTSYITHNLSNGSRTIIHHRDLPEYSFSDFQQLDLKQFDWFHFEGRNVTETQQMLAWAKQHVPSVPRSVEIEKERDGIDSLFELADVLLFSRPFALGRGHDDAVSLLNTLRPYTAGARLICAWGDAGAWALDEKQSYHSPAFPPPTLVDTLGAGDTFNAGIIDALVRGLDLGTALQTACRLAGQKCGYQGFDFVNNQEISP